MEYKTKYQDTKKHYNIYVTVEKGNLYCKKDSQYEICGNLKNIDVPLLATNNFRQKYFQIKDTEYYLFYEDMKPIEKLDVIIPNYIAFNKNIHTKKSTQLYQNGEVVLSIDQEKDFSLFYQDTENYYVKYLEQIFALPKNENIEITEHQNTEEKIAVQIPVIYYENIDALEQTENWELQLQLLKENSNYTISLSDYQNWKDGNIQLKEKAILLLSKKDTQIENYQIYNIETSSIPFRPMNAVSTPNKPYIYQVKDTTTKDQFHHMLVGNPVITTSLDQKVAVLNYHFFYDSDIGEVCNENICLEKSKFEEQLAYLKNNGYYTLSMEEFRDWMYGKIDIPQKSVLLTVDDGAKGTGKHNGNQLISLLEKYDLHATLFLITGWWDIENYRSSNLDIESHTHDMHTMYQLGAQMLVSSHEHVINDLNKSVEITKSKKAFCFPFYAYNEVAIEQVKQVGFELSFIGGNYKASRKSDKYKIPRYPIYKGITMQQFINMIS